MDTQEVKDAFIEMTKKLIRQVTDERELQNVRPELLREIRSNVWNLMEQERRTSEPPDNCEKRTYAVSGTRGFLDPIPFR